MQKSAGLQRFWRIVSGNLGFEGFDDVAVSVDTAGEQGTTKTTTGIDKGRVLELRNAQVVWVPACKNAFETIKRLFEPEEAGMPPPE